MTQMTAAVWFFPVKSILLWLGINGRTVWIVELVCLLLTRLAAHLKIKSRMDRTVTSGDISISKVELVSLHNRKGHALVVWSRLKKWLQWIWSQNCIQKNFQILQIDISPVTDFAGWLQTKAHICECIFTATAFNLSPGSSVFKFGPVQLLNILVASSRCNWYS